MKPGSSLPRYFSSYFSTSLSILSLTATGKQMQYILQSPIAGQLVTTRERQEYTHTYLLSNPGGQSTSRTLFSEYKRCWGCPHTWVPLLQPDWWHPERILSLSAECMSLWLYNSIEVHLQKDKLSICIEVNVMQSERAHIHEEDEFFSSIRWGSCAISLQLCMRLL